MTQKELLYLEDAIGHEDMIIQILNESINSLENEDLIKFLETKKKEHTKFKERLLKEMEECANA